MQNSKLNRVNIFIYKSTFTFNFKLLTLNFRDSSGFTLLELIMVIAVIAVLSGLVTASLLNVNQKATLSASIIPLLSDIKQQQIKAMVGDTEGNNIAGNYGVYFEPTRYTLFHNSSYSSIDSTNYVVDLDSNLQFSSITFPSSQIIFATTSGEIANFSPGQNAVILIDTKNNDQKIIQINRYGVITQVQ